MRFAIVLAAAAATIVAAQDLGNVQDCSDPQGLADCAGPYVSAVNDCATSDVDCYCKVAKSGQEYAPSIPSTNRSN